MKLYGIIITHWHYNDINNHTPINGVEWYNFTSLPGNELPCPLQLTIQIYTVILLTTKCSSTKYY